MSDLQPGKPRKPAGPKPKLVNARTINLGLTVELIEKARAIGKGNISDGVRRCIESFQSGSAK